MLADLLFGNDGGNPDLHLYVLPMQQLEAVWRSCRKGTCVSTTLYYVGECVQWHGFELLSNVSRIAKYACALLVMRI